jgi:hypothetical protein
VKRMVAMLIVVGACIATPGWSAPERFTADQPTPLHLLKPGKQDGNAARFGGSVRLSGQFLVIWERGDRKPAFRLIMFFPDTGSAALLPRAAGAAPVHELFLGNREQAGPMLLGLGTVETPLDGDRIGSEGAATVLIRDYQAVVECDQRRYVAQLVSAARDKEMVVSARERAQRGC